MCGRFYVDEDVWWEIQKIAATAGQAANVLWSSAESGFAGVGSGGSRRDIFPSGSAFVIKGAQNHLEAQKMHWGYHAPGLKKIVINARAETVQEKRMFRQDFAYRRCLIPAKGFYEWKRSGAEKARYQFFGENGILYLAGIYHASEQGDEFTILTREAAGCMTGIHSRMPLIIRPADLEGWLFSPEEAGRLLDALYPELQREGPEGEGRKSGEGKAEPEYEQMSLF